MNKITFLVIIIHELQNSVIIISNGGIIVNKTIRQNRLVQIIDQNIVTSQEELMNLLKQEDIDATQATISRDIRDLNIVKIRDSQGHLRYQVFNAAEHSPNVKFRRTFRSVVLDVTQIQFINIIKTLPHNGDLLAEMIDQQNLPEVAATIAGHDTILVFSTDENNAQQMQSYFQSLIGKLS